MKKHTKLIVFGLIFFILAWLVVPPLSWNITDRFVVVIKPKQVTLPIVNKKISLYKAPQQGLDLKGGTRLIFALRTSQLPPPRREEAARVTRNIIERRINFFGVSEPNILMTQTGEDYRVIVELPGVTSSQKASSMIGKVAQLDFREYKEEKITIGTQSATIPQFTKTKLTGTLLSSASVDFNNPKGEPQVLLVFNKQGKELFAQITKKNLKKPLAIFLDDSLLTAPVVQSEIRDGRAVISGSFSTQDAQQLASTLSAGALPVRTTLLETSTIEPTIGAQNIQRSILAGIVGIACVLVFMLVLYRLNGVFAVVSLVAFGLITLLVYEFSGIVITLSGIAGLFLSVGMAVDANILIYERIKEEELNHPRSGAVRLGFQKALRAIREANINTLLIALVLFNPLNLSFLPLSGSVRGFAATLAIGVIVGYITGVVITKNLLWYFYKVDTHD